MSSGRSRALVLGGRLARDPFAHRGRLVEGIGPPRSEAVGSAVLEVEGEAV
jgi:hypothetical protein